MSDGQRGAWFAPRRHGYGSDLPIKWQGWASLALLLVVTMLPWLVVSWSAAAQRYLVATVILGTLINIVALIVFLYVCKSRPAGGWRGRDDDRA